MNNRTGPLGKYLVDCNYGPGRPVGLSDHAAMNRILAESKEADYGLRTPVHAIVASELFQAK